MEGYIKFSSPFSGTFFQFTLFGDEMKTAAEVFVPFLGDLFSII